MCVYIIIVSIQLVALKLTQCVLGQTEKTTVLRDWNKYRDKSGQSHLINDVSGNNNIMPV